MTEDALESAPINLPSSRELAGLLQDELSTSTGMAARWAADRVHGNTGSLAQWVVPFESDHGPRGSFILRWSSELQRHLASRLGTAAARPEFMGSILRSTAGRWAQSQAQGGRRPLRLQPSPDPDGGPAPQAGLRSTAALLLDSHVLELTFVLEHPRG